MVNELIDKIIAVEDGYVNHPSDRGGPTRYGITEAVAREAGYTGDMKELPIDLAQRIYANTYFYKPKFDRIYSLNKNLGEKIADAGVNIGPPQATKLFQRALSVLQNMPVAVDGVIGPATIAALSTYLSTRKNGDAILFKAFNCLQGEYYIDITEDRRANRDFINGWFANRIA